MIIISRYQLVELRDSGGMFKFILIFLVLISHVENAKILGVWPEQGKSHFVMFEKLMKGLVARGHEVDVLSHFPQKIKIERYTDLSVAGSLPSFTNNITMQLVEDLGFWGDIYYGMFMELGVDLCKAIFATDAAKQLLNSDKKYDLLITEMFATDCFLGYAHHFKIPSVVLTTSVNLPWGADRIGNPDNPSYIPNYFAPFLNEMNIYERFINTALVAITKLGYDWVSVEGSNVVAREYFGADLPDLRNLANNVSLMLVNSHFSMNFARPTVPNFVEVGGLHVGEPKPLPEYYEKLMQSKSGIIYLGMGSMMRTESWTNKKLQAMFDALADLPYKVLWKGTKQEFNETLRFPTNIHFETWMPQFDILCHPNLKLFINHGGLMGSQEATYCGVPRLGIPMFADQKLNLRASEAMNLTVQIDYKDITYESFLATLKLILDDPKYLQNNKEISKMYKDRPMHPLDTAIYWMEYVIRHKGAPQLRSKGADLVWYKYFLLDIIAIILLIILISYKIITTLSSKKKYKLE